MKLTAKIIALDADGTLFEDSGPKIFAHEYWDNKAVTLKMICGG